MKSKIICVLTVVLLGLFLSAPLCWAKEKSFNFIVAYSFKTKTVYHTPIFESKVEGVSYNDEEYVSDTGTILEMESAFQKFMDDVLKLNSMDYTIGARMAYKTDEIAKKKLEKEIGGYRFKGYTIEEVNAFKFN